MISVMNDNPYQAPTDSQVPEVRRPKPQQRMPTDSLLLGAFLVSVVIGGIILSFAVNRSFGTAAGYLSGLGATAVCVAAAVRMYLR